MQTNRQLLQVKMALYFGFGVVAVAAFLPWVDLGPFSQDGIDGDGVLTLVFGAVGLGFAHFDNRPRGMLIAVSLAALVLVIGFVNYIDISGGVGEAGIGVYLTMLGALVATLAGGILAFSMFKKPVAPGTATEAPPADSSPPPAEQ